MDSGRAVEGERMTKHWDKTSEDLRKLGHKVSIGEGPKGVIYYIYLDAFDVVWGDAERVRPVIEGEVTPQAFKRQIELNRKARAASA